MAGGYGLGILMQIFSKKKKTDQKAVKELRVTILGLDNSGKTTILKAIAHEEI